MALSDYLKRGAIGPSLKGQFYQYERNGRWVTAKWPKKRGKPKSQLQADVQYAFSAVTKAIKGTAAEIQTNHREASKGTPMLPRDSLMAALYGNGPVVRFYSGKVIKPMTSKYLASTVLDAIGWAEGSILYRGPENWEVIAPGLNGQVLSWDEPNRRPLWVDQGGGGGFEKAVNFMPGSADSGAQNWKWAHFQPVEGLTLTHITMYSETPASYPLNMAVVTVAAGTVIDAILMPSTRVGTGIGGGQFITFPLPSQLPIAPGQRFAIGLSNSSSDAIFPTQIFTVSQLTCPVPMLGICGRSVMSGVALSPGQALGAVTRQFWTIGWKAL